MISLRKVLTLIGILIVLAASALAYVDYNQGLGLFKPKGLPLLQTSRAAEDLVPAGPVVYVSLRDGAKLWKKIKGSNFYQRARQLATDSPRKTSGKPSWLESERRLEQNLGLKFDEQNLLRLFGKKVVLALYGIDGKAGLDGLLITETDMAARVWGYLVRLKSKYGKDPAAPQAIPYRGVEIFAFHSTAPKDMGTGYYAFVGKYLLAATRASRLKSAIDLALGAPEAKSARPRVREAAGGLGKTPFLVFVADTGRAVDWIQSLVPAAQRPVLRRAILNGAGISGRFALTASLDRGLLIQTRAAVDPSRMNPQQEKEFRRSSGDYRSIALIPQNALVYAADNSFDARLSWKQNRPVLVESRRASSSGKQGLQGLEKEFGISIERDLVPLVGGEWAYALLPAGSKSPLPVPAVLVAVQVKNRAKADRVMRRILSRLTGGKAGRKGSFAAKRLHRFSYRGTRITYLQFPHMFSPGYTFIRGFLVLSTDKNILRRALDSSSGKAGSLEKSADFRAALTHLSGKSNSMFFIDGNRIVASLAAGLSMLSALGPTPVNVVGTGSAPLASLELLRVAPLAVGEIVHEKTQVSGRLFVALADIPKVSKTPVALPAGSPTGLTEQASARVDLPITLADSSEIVPPPPRKVRGKRGALRDPFRPVILPEKVRKAMQPRIIPATPLQRYSLASLKLVGIIWGGLGNKALIQAPDGKGYTVVVGTHIGARGGVIAEIRPDGMVVQEKREDEFGRLHRVDVFVPLKEAPTPSAAKR